MSALAADPKPRDPSGQGDRGRSRSFIVWVFVVLAVAVAAVILGWRADAGPADPTAGHMSATSAVINSAVLVFREGLETILVLAAITAGFSAATGPIAARSRSAARWPPPPPSRPGS